MNLALSHENCGISQTTVLYVFEEKLKCASVLHSRSSGYVSPCEVRHVTILRITYTADHHLRK
jgi:hypothetical protein